MKLELELTDEQLRQIAAVAAELVPVAEAPAPDGWLDKRMLAEHLGMSPRWVDYRTGEGMPHVLIAGRPRFRTDEVEAWLAERGHLRPMGDPHSTHGR